MSALDTDVLIVGAGGAGLITALNASSRRVCVLAPAAFETTDTSSDIAQGGIAAAVGADDSPTLHLRDTLRAGAHHNRSAAAWRVCREAPDAINYLAALGVGFTRAADEWSLHTEAAHSRPRVLHVDGDATGAAIMQVLRRQVAAAAHVERLSHARAVALLRDTSGVCGVAAMTGNGQLLTIRARDVVIATGGIGGLYSRSTNPLAACGDGPAMALSAGARCEDLEFVQFHPTALDVDAAPLPLMTEALRGAGARLVNDAGVQFMREVHPLGELAPRDVVARAIYAVQAAGGRVWLDATRLTGTRVAEAFPSAYKICRAYGIDADRDLIPVTPAAHYHMGGIAVNLDGRASLPRLWAVGEAACTGLHGANRLASNSLLEAVVFGRRAAQALNRQPPGPERLSDVLPPLPAIADERADWTAPRELREIMWRRMGLVRNASGIAEGLSLIAHLREQIPPTRMLSHSRLLLAEHMMLAAARRLSSCGAHYRSDCADSNAKLSDARARRGPLPRRKHSAWAARAADRCSFST
ncbi:L-aspartate oxidase [Peristeroidobacter agariperforans]|uniref:L-aspartate oxidase n=1 Tax=Peristeroidobacter agariperforans TaxID=268404 RepID=UPI00101BB7FA|nr:L-aspartate oxidase [Peristeroidobacter agariperforans]